MTTTATLRLRVRRGRITTRLFWPEQGTCVQRMLVALVDPSDARLLCRQNERVVLALPPTTSGDDLWDLVRWAATHAAELGARDDAVTIIADGDESRRELAWLADRARADGWPDLTVKSTHPQCFGKDTA